jgi:hypothetical protein
MDHDVVLKVGTSSQGNSVTVSSKYRTEHHDCACANAYLANQSRGRSNPCSVFHVGGMSAKAHCVHASSIEAFADAGTLWGVNLLNSLSYLG